MVVSENNTLLFSSGDDLLGQLEQSIQRRQQRRVPLCGRPEAGVLVAVTDDARDPEVVLTRRAKQMSSHPGEVALPGGKRDPEDESLVATALREAHEEIDLHPGQVRVVAGLDQMVSKHGYVVTPYLGVIPSRVELSANPDELDAVFRVPLRFLLDRQQYRLEQLRFEGRQIESPLYHYQGFRIWGLTAFILTTMLNQGLAAELPLPSRTLR